MSGFDLVTCAIQSCYEFDHRGAAVSHEKCETTPNSKCYWPKLDQGVLDAGAYNSI